jgi:hypothetical protein
MYTRKLLFPMFAFFAITHVSAANDPSNVFETVDRRSDICYMIWPEAKTKHYCVLGFVLSYADTGTLQNTWAHLYDTNCTSLESPALTKHNPVHEGVSLPAPRIKDKAGLVISEWKPPNSPFIPGSTRGKDAGHIAFHYKGRTVQSAIWPDVTVDGTNWCEGNHTGSRQHCAPPLFCLSCYIPCELTSEVPMEDTNRILVANVLGALTGSATMPSKVEAAVDNTLQPFVSTKLLESRGSTVEARLGSSTAVSVGYESTGTFRALAHTGNHYSRVSAHLNGAPKPLGPQTYAKTAASGTPMAAAGQPGNLASQASPAVAFSPTIQPPSEPASDAQLTGVLTGACAQEASWNCIAGTHFQQCAGGKWTQAQGMAAGTNCRPGEGIELHVA